MSVSAYAYVNARIGGMKSYLLNEEDYRGLIESRNLDELVSLLRNTRYGPDIADTNVLSLELQLKKTLYRDYLKLINSVEKKPKFFVAVMAKKFEIDTLKSLITMNFLKIKLDEYVIPFGSIDQPLIEKLFTADGIVEFVELLKGTEYYTPLKNITQIDQEAPVDSEADVKKALLPFHGILDSYYYENVKEALRGLSRKDKNMVKKFVGFNIDISNFQMALRLRGVEEDVIEYFIDGGNSFTLKHFSIVRNLEDMSRLGEVVPKNISEIAALGLEIYNETKSLLSFDLAVKKQVLLESKKMFFGNRFHIGIIIAYLNLKENEISNLIKIIKTTDEFFDPREIEKILVLV